VKIDDDAQPEIGGFLDNSVQVGQHAIAIRKVLTGKDEARQAPVPCIDG
jgi:hypothetical protein